MKSERGYEQTLRAQKRVETEARIIEEAERLFATELFDRVTLDAVARAAGVSIPTLQRRFANKEGLFAAVADRARARIDGQRGAPLEGDVKAAMAQLIGHYELEGRMVWHLLRQEGDVPLLRAAVQEGRAHHRAWVERAFAHALAGAGSARKLDALVAATDLYVWKLLRIDLGRTRADVEQLMNAMAAAVAGGL